MKLSLVLLLLAACFVVSAQSGTPRMTSVEPAAGKAGDIIAITGENLHKEAVAKVYLTDDRDEKNDVQCEVTEQTATAMKIKLPAKATGRLSLMILTAGKEGRLLVQPVKVSIQ